MTSLQLDPHSLVFTSEHILHIVNRRGRFDLKGKNIHLLHERIASRLNGTLREEELLAAVPLSQKPAVRSYLLRLREVGVLLEVRSSNNRLHGEALKLLGAAVPKLQCQIGDHLVDILLEGNAPMNTAGATLSLRFVSPMQAGKSLLTIGGREKPVGSRVLIVVESAPTTIEVERRADYARWLLAGELSVSPGDGRLSLYRLSSSQESLTRLAVVEKGGSAASGTLPQQLSLIKQADLDQAPLVTAVAEHPFYRARVARFGVTDEAVHEQILETFISQIWMESDEWAEGQLMLYTGDLGAPLSTYRSTRLDSHRFTEPLLAPTWMQLRLRMLEHWANRRASGSPPLWRRTDLLDRNPAPPLIRYLIGVLRRRASHLYAFMTQTSEGLTCLRVGQNQEVALIGQEALTRILLRSVWQEFYAERYDGLKATPAVRLIDVASLSQLHHEAKALENALHGMQKPRILVRRICCWGRTVWMGSFQDPILEA